MPKPKTVYLIGKVTGLKPKVAALKYKLAKAICQEHGYDPVSPIDHVDPKATWNQAMKVCIPLLLTCDYYALLDDPGITVGGHIERTIAEWVNIPRILITNL